MEFFPIHNNFPGGCQQIILWFGEKKPAKGPGVGIMGTKKTELVEEARNGLIHICNQTDIIVILSDAKNLDLSLRFAPFRMTEKVGKFPFLR